MGDAAHEHRDGYFHELEEEIMDEIADPHIAPEFWFNVVTKQIEEGPQSLGIDRLGPFKTREEAARAEQTIAERGAAWNAEDAED